MLGAFINGLPPRHKRSSAAALALLGRGQFVQGRRNRPRLPRPRQRQPGDDETVEEDAEGVLIPPRAGGKEVARKHRHISFAYIVPSFAVDSIASVLLLHETHPDWVDAARPIS